METQVKQKSTTEKKITACTIRDRDEEVIEKCSKNFALVKERRKKKAQAPRKRCAITRILRKVTKLKYIFKLSAALGEEKTTFC